MSTESPNVYNRGPLSDAADGYTQSAVLLMNNGAFYDIVPPQDALLVNPLGRGIRQIDITEITKQADGTSSATVNTWVDWIEAESGHIGSDVPEATSLAFDTSIIQEYGAIVQAELLAVDMSVLEVTLKDVIVAAMSTAYLAGRADQIADMLGTNDKRFVRLKDLLPLMNNASNPFVSEPFGQFASEPKLVLEEFRSLQGTLEDRKDELKVDYHRQQDSPYERPEFVRPLTVSIENPVN